MATSSSPLLDKHHFLFKEILRHDPLSSLSFCKALQEQWEKEYSSDPKLAARMKAFKKNRCMHLVWVSDKFGGSLSDEISELKTYCLLSDEYDRARSDPRGMIPISESESSGDHGNPGNISPPPDSNAECDRKSELQLRQHLHALLYLFNAAEAKHPLSEELIKQAHRILMNNLYTEDKVKINAGEYRKCIVGSGITHTYPDFEFVPDTMEQIVRNYMQRCADPKHDPFALAGWLLFELLDIHPFEDGNGRVSRLLWCFSLLRDGLPFPVTPFPEHKKAYKKYIMCIERDRELSISAPQCKYLTSLTLISVTMTWKNFIHNQRVEATDKYREIIKWMEETGNTLQEYID